MNYKTTTLDTFVTLQRGFDLPIQNRRHGKVPVVAANGIAGYHDEAKVKSVCVVLGRSGTVGNPQLIVGPFWPLNTTLFVKDFHGNLPVFVYYVLKTIDFKSFDAGGTVPTLNRNHLTQIKVPLLDLKLQEVIGEILFNLDKKIAINKALSKSLEDIAQTIFKSWFIDFDPVKAKMNGEKPIGMDDETAALFPDSFENSELGLIPQGWEVRKIEQLAKITGGKMLNREEINESGEFPVFGGAGIMGYTNQNNADEFVLCVGRVGAYCGQFFYHIGKAWINNNASLIISKNIEHSEWLYLTLRNFDVESIKKGAAQPFVSNSDLLNSKVITGGGKLITRFTSIVGPILQMIIGLSTQNLMISNLRDSLLPRLISGELQIPEEMLAS